MNGSFEGINSTGQLSLHRSIYDYTYSTLIAYRISHEITIFNLQKIETLKIVTKIVVLMDGNLISLPGANR